MSQEKDVTINPSIIKQVRCKTLYKYTGNILKYKEIYNVIKEKKDSDGTIRAYKLMDSEGNILKSYYFKWRFYDTDFISDILLIKDEKAAIPEDMGLTIYLYYLNNSTAAFSFNYKKEIMGYFLNGDTECMLTEGVDVEILNIPAITETITFLNIKEITNKINFLISKNIIVKNNDSIRLTSQVITVLKCWEEFNGNKHLLDKEILLNDLYKLQSSCFKPFTEPTNSLKKVNFNKNYFFGTDSIPVFVFIFFKKIVLSVTKNTTSINFKNTLTNYIHDTFSFYYKKDNTFINNQTIVSLNKEIHNFTYGKPYLVLNSKKIRNSLEIIKLETDNPNIFKYIDKRYLKIIEQENSIPLFIFHKFTKIFYKDKPLNYIDICAYKLCIIFIYSYLNLENGIVIKNKSKHVMNNEIVEKIICCVKNIHLYNTKSWFRKVPITSVFNQIENANESNSFFNDGIFEINSKKLESQLKSNININF